MAKGGKTKGTGEAEPFDFSLGTKRELRAQRKEWVLDNSEHLSADLKRFRDKIDWDALRQASTEDEVNAALSALDQYTRDRLPNAAVILATVRDPDYPKLRPIRFLAESCALARTYGGSGEHYSPRYSRDVCYQERKRRGPPPKALTNLEYWVQQAKLGQKVPVKYLPRINKLQAKEQTRSEPENIRTV